MALRLVSGVRSESHRGLRTMAGRLYPVQGPDLPPAVALELYEVVATVGSQFDGHLSEMDLQHVRMPSRTPLLPVSRGQSWNGCLSALHCVWRPLLPLLLPWSCTSWWLLWSPISTATCPRWPSSTCARLTSVPNMAKCTAQSYCKSSWLLPQGMVVALPAMVLALPA